MRLPWQCLGAGVATTFAALCSASIAAQAQTLEKPDPFACTKLVTTSAALNAGRSQPITPANTACFDHYFLKPAENLPLVIEVEDGEYFQVLIGNTDTTLFNYTITAVPTEETPSVQMGATGAGTAATRWDNTTLTMRHTEIFERYRVVLALRDGVAAPGARRDDRAGAAGSGRGPQAVPPDPEARDSKPPMLFPATFDVWVRTAPGFEVSFTGGVAFSGLRSPQFFAKTDDKGNADPADDTTTIEEDHDAKDGFRPDTVAVTNIRHPKFLKGLGLSFGVGLNNDADPRYFLGPSYFLGRHVLLTTGWTGGRVDRLPNGQELGGAPINGDSTLDSLPKRFAHGFFVGIAFAFVPDAEDNFKGAFGSSQDVEPPAEPAPAARANPATPATPPGEVSADERKGEYVSDAGKAVVEPKNGQISVTLPTKTAIDLTQEGTVFVSADKALSCSFSKASRADGSTTVTLECLETGEAPFKGTRTLPAKP